MNRAFSGQGFSGHRASFGFGSGMRGPGMGEVFDQLRAAFEDRGPGRRMARGDVRSAVLALLAEQPMHGYQIITEIAQRSDGAWKPSAGSVYPTLQQLADEGLVVATESEGRKTYTLTDCLSFVMMRRLQLTTALATDHHFRQEGFQTVP